MAGVLVGVLPHPEEVVEVKGPQQVDVAAWWGVWLEEVVEVKRLNEWQWGWLATEGGCLGSW